MATLNQLTNLAVKHSLSVPIAGGKTPVSPCRGEGLTYAQGPHVTYGKKFLGACKCMTVVVL